MIRKKPQVIYKKTYEEARRECLIEDLVITNFKAESEWDSWKHRPLAKALNFAEEECKAQIIREAKRVRADYIFMQSAEYILGCPQDAVGFVSVYAELGKLRQTSEVKERLKNQENLRGL